MYTEYQARRHWSVGNLLSLSMARVQWYRAACNSFKEMVGWFGLLSRGVRLAPTLGSTRRGMLCEIECVTLGLLNLWGYWPQGNCHVRLMCPRFPCEVQHFQGLSRNVTEIPRNTLVLKHVCSIQDSSVECLGILSKPVKCRERSWIFCQVPSYSGASHLEWSMA